MPREHSRSRVKPGEDQQEGPGGPDVAAMPTFLQPQAPRQDPVDRVQLQQQPTDHQRADPADDSAGAGPDRPMMAEDAGPSPESTAEVPRLRPLATAAQVQTARTVVEAALMGATAIVNKRAAQGPEDRRWLMTPAQRRAIASPFARMIARRTPLPGSGESASDIADTVEGFVGIIGYVLEQIMSAPGPGPVPVMVEDSEPAAPVGPGATVNPFDPGAL